MPRSIGHERAAPPVKRRARTPVRKWATVVLAIVGLLVVAGLLAKPFLFKVSTRTASVATGVTAPEFALTNDLGTTTTLAGLVAHGPAVLVFYRGYW